MNKNIKNRIISIIISLCFIIGIVGTFPAIDSQAAIVPKNGNQTLMWNTPISGVFEKSGDAIYRYYFNLQTSGKVSFTGSTSDCVGFQIFNSAGDSITSEVSIYKETGTLVADLLAGKYYFDVSNGLNYEKFEFIATFVSSGETVNENYLSTNNSVGAATPYSIGKNYTGHLATNDDKDMYKFTLKKPGYLKLNIFTDVLREYDIDIVNTLDTVKYREDDLGIGRTIKTYFVPAGTYYFTVYRESSSNGYVGNYSFNLSFSKIPKVAVKQFKNPAKKTVVVKCASNSKAEGYQVQISKSSNFKKGNKSQTKDGKTSTTFKFGGLKKGSVYYARVRTYVTDGNGKKYFSAWSKVKKVKIKK
ncbi:MAG: hypothetical protein K6B68_07015 [Eubacterium sp.]|nr:hypothetical protein [Eubacterium sp.]